MVRSTITAALALAALGSVALVAQQPQTPPTYETAIANTWKNLHNKILTMAKDTPKPKTRASVVTEMAAALAASFPLVEKSPSPRLIGWIDHQGEHYGKLVSSYRLVGIVPPVSRPRARGGSLSIF